MNIFVFSCLLETAELVAVLEWEASITSQLEQHNWFTAHFEQTEP